MRVFKIISLVLAAVSLSSCGGGGSSSSKDPWSEIKLLRAPSATSSNAHVVKDSNGNLYVSGTTNGSLEGNLYNGGNDYYLAKYSSDGEKLWVVQNGPLNASVTVKAMLLTPQEDIILVGTTEGSVDLFLPQIGHTDTFMMKYRKDGVFLTGLNLGIASSSFEGFTATTNSAGDIFIAATAFGALSGMTQKGMADLVLLKYNSYLTPVWRKNHGYTDSYIIPQTMSLDSDGNIVVGGKIYETGSSQYSQYYLGKFDSNGEMNWDQKIGSAVNKTNIVSLSISSNNDIYAGIESDGAFGGWPLIGINDVFLSKVSGVNGITQWTKPFGEAGKDSALPRVKVADDKIIFIYSTVLNQMTMDFNTKISQILLDSTTSWKSVFDLEYHYNVVNNFIVTDKYIHMVGYTNYVEGQTVPEFNMFSLLKTVKRSNGKDL